MRTRLFLPILILLMALPEARTVAQGALDGTYTDAAAGFVVTWDTEAFMGQDLGVSTGVIVSNDDGSLVVTSGSGATAAECLDYAITAASIPPTLQAFAETTVEHEPIVPLAELTGAVALTDADGVPKYGWYGCIPAFGPRGDARGYVLITLAAPVTSWDATVIAFQPVIDAIQVPAADPAWDDALVGNRFTNRADGWSVAWDAERYSATISGTSTPIGVHLVREGTIEYGDVYSFEGDVARCVSSFADYYATYEGVVSFDEAALKGPKIEADGAESGIWLFTYQPTDVGSAPRTFVEWVSCLPVAGHPERSLRISFSTSEDLFKSTRKGWQAIVRSLELTPAATPIA